MVHQSLKLDKMEVLKSLGQMNMDTDLKYEM